MFKPRRSGRKCLPRLDDDEDDDDEDDEDDDEDDDDEDDEDDEDDDEDDELYQKIFCKKDCKKLAIFFLFATMGSVVSSFVLSQCHCPRWARV